jgi:hypothetical protein
MRFVPFRFNSISYQILHPHFFIYDFSIKFNLYRFSDLPHFENIFAAVLLPHHASKIACFSIFSELLLDQFQVGNSLGSQKSSKTHNLIFLTKHLDFSMFISYLRFVLIFPDTRNLLTKPHSSAPNTFTFRIKDFSTLYNFFDFRLDYAKFFPTFHFFSKASSSFVSSGSQDYILSFFSVYFSKNTTLFS